MIYITGDTHGSYSHIARFCASQKHMTSNDIIIILGDTGLNYFKDERDYKKKLKVMRQIPATLFCIHGNHDRRPQTLNVYREQEFNGGIVYCQEDFPRLLFAKDGEVFNFDNRTTLVIGGAYSIDKHIRLLKGYHWFKDEQPNQKIKRHTTETLMAYNWQIDTILSHTCPLKYEPTEAFFKSINQNEVDKSTELWLNDIENRLSYNKWFCGHFHIDKTIDRLRFVYRDILAF